MAGEQYNKISIIIPTWNEEDNILMLVQRIHTVLYSNGIEYEIIFIDDHSTDQTRNIIKTLSSEYPISLYLKQGKKGKAQSLLEGFTYANYGLVGMIDADLQYPPEAFPAMITKIKSGADVIVANRSERQISPLRRLTSRSFSFIFGRLTHGFNCDIQ